MVRGISTFTNLPTPFKAGLIIVSGGGILAVLRILHPPSIVYWAVFIGLAIVALCLFLYWRLLKWLKKRKAAPMEQDLLKSSSATPQGISEPANVAKLDDLRKKFEEGTRKFQSAGKSLYSFPWYVIVGEPGSGKTEAIRHCNVGFPPGLQDEFQGTGGTINMNWWFTDHAVILDTAGRLMFEEVETGGSKEWREFLNLMKKYRPRCPINGVLLVIPADSLIRDTADQIEQKASKIARQFDAIQRTLDVRFPVFVVVTKSDLINGFRDFFDNLQDPQLQHQILGWSNPAPLDEPYNTDFIDQHLKAIRGRLFRRRLALLHEVMSEEPGVDKIRTADTLYAFPQSLAKLAPRMARYLELIFSVGSKWSCKPLFFRGIYFTSSMREGSALDEDLAESLGVPVDSLPDGRVWERDRAYFLRDLFVKKIFREQGLVTYATNAKSLHRRRKTAVLVSAAAGLILLLFFAFYAARKLDKSIGKMEEFFVGFKKVLVTESNQNELHVIKEKSGNKYRYVGGSSPPKPLNKIEEGGITLSNISTKLSRVVKDWEKKKVPWIFRPVDFVVKGITPEKLKKAQAEIYEVSILQPSIQAVRNLMSAQEGGEWIRSPETRTLRQLIQLSANKPLNKDDIDEYSSKTFLDPFFEYVLRNGEDIESKEKSIRYRQDSNELHEPLAIIYDRNGAWPPSFLKTEPNFFEATIKSGVGLFNEYWTTQSEEDAQIEDINNLVTQLRIFNNAEERIIDLKKTNSIEGLDQQARIAFVNKWNKSYVELDIAKKSIDDNAQSLGNPRSLATWWATAATDAKKKVVENYKFHLDELDPCDVKGSFLADVRVRLELRRDKILERLQPPDFNEQSLSALDNNFYTWVEDRGPLYQIRFEMYSKANEQLSKLESISRIDEVPRVMDEVEKAVEKAQGEINELETLISKYFRAEAAAGICNLAVELGGKRRSNNVVKSGLEEAINQVHKLIKLPEVESYDPNVAIPVLQGWKRVADWLNQHGLPEKEVERIKQKYNEARPEYAEYTNGYLNYWLNTVPGHWLKSIESKIPRENNWEAQHNKLKKLDLNLHVFAALGKFGKSIEEKALDKLENYIPEDNDSIKKFRSSMETLRDTLSFRPKYKEILEKWQDLSSDPFEARNTFLSKDPESLVKDYFPFSARSSSVELVGRYWTELAQVSLSVLAKEIQYEGRIALETLGTKYGNKFPLAQDSTQDLTPAEVREARSSIVRALSVGVYDQGTVGDGKETDFDEVNEQLRLLREPPVPEDLQQWVQGIKQVFQGLPEGKDLYYCRIILLGQKEQKNRLSEGEKLLLDDFRGIKIIQEGIRTDKFGTRYGGDKPIAIVKYPGPLIRIDFYRYPGDEKPVPDLEPLEFQKEWACLRMLQLPYYNGGKGYVKLNIRSEKGLGGVLFLRLRFYKDRECKIPIDDFPPDEWPKLQK
ncbi:MAG: type VI secretion protein IcmF/TssM N-terminal domain-containing protein [Planctomycetota bacterium]|jgi:macrodomain Ter protein organizer (MatP/YcbG family)